MTDDLISLADARRLFATEPEPSPEPTRNVDGIFQYLPEAADWIPPGILITVDKKLTSESVDQLKEFFKKSKSPACGTLVLGNGERANMDLLPVAFDETKLKEALERRTVILKVGSPTALILPETVSKHVLEDGTEAYSVDGLVLDLAAATESVYPVVDPSQCGAVVTELSTTFDDSQHVADDGALRGAVEILFKSGMRQIHGLSDAADAWSGGNLPDRQTLVASAKTIRLKVQMMQRIEEHDQSTVTPNPTDEIQETVRRELREMHQDGEILAHGEFVVRQEPDIHRHHIVTQVRFPAVMAPVEGEPGHGIKLSPSQQEYLTKALRENPHLTEIHVQETPHRDYRPRIFEAASDMFATQEFRQGPGQRPNPMLRRHPTESIRPDSLDWSEPKQSPRKGDVWMSRSGDTVTVTEHIRSMHPAENTVMVMSEKFSNHATSLNLVDFQRDFALCYRKEQPY